MGSRNLLIFDIETIPDTDACFRLTGYKSNDVNALRKEMERYHLEITDGRNSFLRQPFHKVIVIGILIAEYNSDGDNAFLHIKELKSGSIEDFSEEELLSTFFHWFAKVRPRLVSFNGRTFDLPVLRYRAMKYNIQCEALYDSGDKWNNYMNRYSFDWHCDLLEVLSDYGASARIKMSELCAIFDLPGKMGLEGSQVAQMYDHGKIKDIRDYCEIDILNTYLIYLRWMHHQGKLRPKGYLSSEENLINYLKSESVNKIHLARFLEEWKPSVFG